MSADPWDLHALQWHRIGAPLRPAPEDLAIVTEAATRWQATHPERPLRALLLGVTPELATLAWPPGTTLTAVDRSPGMIRDVWPGALNAALCADWRALPLPDGSVDLIAGDGCSCLLRFPRDLGAVGAEVRRVLAPGGVYVLRAFVQPAQQEDVAAVGAALWSGGIGSFHAFKWRLAMALQRSTAEGVPLAEVWEAWHALCPDPGALAEARGWPLAAIATIDAYRGVTTVYSFPTLAELRAVMAIDFVESACHTPGYELGERCPTLVSIPLPR